VQKSGGASVASLSKVGGRKKRGIRLSVKRERRIRRSAIKKEGASREKKGKKGKRFPSRSRERKGKKPDGLNREGTGKRLPQQ